MPRPRRERRVEGSQFRKRSDVGRGRGIGREDSRLFDRLRGAGAAEGARTVGGDEHQRARLVKCLDGRRQQFGHRGPGGGDNGDRGVERQDAPEGEKAGAAFLGEAPETERGGACEHGDEGGVARAGTDNDLAHAGAHQRGDDPPGQGHAGVVIAGAASGGFHPGWPVVRGDPPAVDGRWPKASGGGVSGCGLMRRGRRLV